MYAFLEGTVEELGAEGLVLGVQGVGYDLNVSSKTLGALHKGDKVRLLTHLHIAEGVLALYGFADIQERTMFQRLISISRVGPKLALAALSTMRAQEIATAIVCEDDTMLARIPGLGKKTAQRIILELREKLEKESGGAAFQTSTSKEAGGGNMRQEAITALLALGYDSNTASRAVQRAGESDSVETLITQALRSLAK